MTISSNISSVDFVIVTALEEERDALLAKLPTYQRLIPSQDDIYTYFSSDLPITFSDNSLGIYRIIVMPLLGMGRVQATAATTAAIHRWQPRYVILVGIAGGIVAREVSLGDILISTQVVDYEVQKLTSEGTQIRWEVHRADPRLIGAARNFTNEGWRELMTIKRPSRGVSKRHIGPIASGDKVIAFAEILKQYQNKWPMLIGVEMEAAGVATASFQTAQPPGFFMVRAVSDLADEKKNSAWVKRWRSYACDAAASYTIALLKSGPVPRTASENQLPGKQIPSKPEEIRNPPSERMVQGYQTLWQVRISLKPEHLFAGPDYLCLATQDALHFLSPTDGMPLLPPLTILEDFPLVDHIIIGGAVAPSGRLLLTLLPSRGVDKGYLLALRFTRQRDMRPQSVSVYQRLYEAPGSQLSAPIIDGELLYLIQQGPALVGLDPEHGQIQRTIPLPTTHNLYQDCVSFAFAVNRLCLALCDGTIVALKPETGDLIATLHKRAGYWLSPLATDGTRLFFGPATRKGVSFPSRIYALDATSGQELWSFEMPPDPAGQHRAIRGKPLVVKDILYVTSNNHYLLALDINTGQEHWRYQMPNRIKLGPVWTGKTIIIADDQGNIHALQPIELALPSNFDVFLAHNTKDKPQVEAIAEKLRQRGLKPWIDQEQIPPGQWFMDNIQTALKNVKSAAVLIGPHGLGRWQELELHSLIALYVKSRRPVIPVLLPGVDHIPDELLFLEQFNWVRFTEGIDNVEALDNLEWGITGKHPRKYLTNIS